MCHGNCESLLIFCGNAPLFANSGNGLADMFKVTRPFANFMEGIKLAKYWSPILKQLWNTSLVVDMVTMKQRNKLYFEDVTLDLRSSKIFIKYQIRCSSGLTKTHMFNSIDDMSILRSWNISLRPRLAPNIQECQWVPPEPHVIKLNADGASFGNPKPSGIGVTYRDNEGAFELVLSSNLICTSFRAECNAIVMGAELALARGWNHMD